ncbi:Dam family site-specific DNA-(adenine-N6)-methyltransferase [Oleiagrimonas citrea]|uniref:Site-specific DNA-methyltransferase (adenine-specific) n=2 Tax=Oleiagrimonas citrea TaxID=1665687 RepID=A0A846ZEX2_9GAMM|nr:Dam family site-specific DNA-(adenine-N6)-methyltransferase [Oleiagrimonas citrea]
MDECTVAVERACLPFVKWAGGKRWLTTGHCSVVPRKYKRYIEPFLGGGAVFFSENPSEALLSDVNLELINAYQVIRDDWRAVARGLARMQKFHNSDYYYKVRSSRPRSDVGRALRFLYLNRTCWNGLYRVNRQGQFNVPKGTKETVVLDTDNFERVAGLLQSACIVSQDFEKSVEQAVAGDFIFVDPPYTVKHNLNGFVKYNEKIFSWSDQVRLKDCLVAAANRGALITVTNADHVSIRELYEGYGSLERVNRSSVLAGSPSRRGRVSELLIRIGW